MTRLQNEPQLTEHQTDTVDNKPKLQNYKNPSTPTPPCCH